MNNDEEEEEPQTIKGLEVIKEEEEDESQKELKKEEIKPVQVKINLIFRKEYLSKALLEIIREPLS